VDWRFDIAMAQKAAEDHPQVEFILAGTLIHEVEEQCAALKSLPNVTMPGRISVEEGRYLLANCSIGLIPFTLGEMNDAINPVKMYAYAFLGKPVAGSAVRELTARPHIADTGATPEEFSAAVSRALHRAQLPEEAAKLKQFALENTWEKRAEQAWAVLEKLF
jgi:glycosyltransferase involved in cell wall biosynthesis